MKIPRNYYIYFVFVAVVILIIVLTKPKPKPDDIETYYNPKYSGSKKSDPNEPLYNKYSKMVKDSAVGVYGFSLDDAVGLKSCGSWTFNTIIGPRCNSENGKCKLPSPGKAVPPDTGIFKLIESVPEYADSQSWWGSLSSYQQAAYLKSDQVSKYLTVYEIKSANSTNTINNTGSIDTDFMEYPQNWYFTNVMNSTQRNVQKDSLFHFAFNIINQCGGPGSLMPGNVPVWASIEMGSPPIVTVVQKILPNQGFQFLFNFGPDSPLSTLAVPQPNPPIRNKKVSNYLERVVGDPPYAECAIECNDNYKRKIEIPAKDLPDTKIIGNAKMCPTGDYTINGVKKGTWDTSVSQYTLDDPNGHCQVLLDPLCNNNPGLVTPICCDDTATNTELNTTDMSKCGLLSDGQGTFQSRHYDWQIGGGRISISLVDPDTLDGVPDDIKSKMNMTPVVCQTPDQTNCDTCKINPTPGGCFPSESDNWRAQRYITGAKIGGGRPDYYASLLEFTIDLNTNINDPNQIIPTIFYDISGVNNLNRLPLYAKAVGTNKSTGDTCATGDCCFTFVGNIGLDPIQNCPTDIYFTKDNTGKVQPGWGKCPSPIDFCDTGYNSFTGQNSTTDPLDSDICNLWNDFTPELIKPTSNSLQTNQSVWGCDPNFIDPEKCRSMHLGVFPNYTQLTPGAGSASVTPFNKPEEYLPFGFECGVVQCKDAKGAKPYQGSSISMDCNSKDDPTCCFDSGGNPTQSGNYCWGNGSVRFKG